MKGSIGLNLAPSIEADARTAPQPPADRQHGARPYPGGTSTANECGMGPIEEEGMGLGTFVGWGAGRIRIADLLLLTRPVRSMNRTLTDPFHRIIPTHHTDRSIDHTGRQAGRRRPCARCRSLGCISPGGASRGKSGAGRRLGLGASVGVRMEGRAPRPNG